ncbi:hypothetical protein M3Y94_00892500 [Aphelenchoides besseyi]|nr:hypothetical protein M3Y94_00892500 [Aphelenchoides besseyi]
MTVLIAVQISLIRHWYQRLFGGLTSSECLRMTGRSMGILWLLHRFPHRLF